MYVYMLLLLHHETVGVRAGRPLHCGVIHL